MIIYSANKSEFRSDVRNNLIDDKIHQKFQENLGHKTARAEIRSWRNSMMYMSNLLEDTEIPDDVGIYIEYILPRSTKKRIDFIITGENNDRTKSAVIVELKQWEDVKKTDQPGIVKSAIGGGIREVSHPSYQAWSYVAFLEDYCDTLEKENIKLSPCAYLHNCGDESDIRDEIYAEDLERAPTFLRNDTQKLTEFIKEHVKYGDQNDLMYMIDSGSIRPTKKLAEAFGSMIEGKEEFIMLDDQKVVFERAMKLAVEAKAKNKHVLIVEGGPGTGKSVVAINLLVKMIEKQLNCKYVTKTEAPRDVLEAKITGKMTKTRFNSLFVGSGKFETTDKNTFDVLINDEAHRLMTRTQYSKHGENQVKEIINASKLSIFFVDEDQKVSLSDIGSVDEIESWAKHFDAQVTKLALESQFRCNGSDGYLAWIDNLLEIKETANLTMEGIDYDIKVFDDAFEMHQQIKKLNNSGQSARTVAGYCWEWKSQKNPDEFDIEIGKLKMKWNMRKHGGKWLIKPETIDEAGSIHRCQGLELDYIGVIIGPDLVVRDQAVITDAFQRHHGDRTIFGFKKLFKENPEAAKALVDPIIKNTYRTLMTRGMKGCYVYCTDEETREYIKKAISSV